MKHKERSPKTRECGVYIVFLAFLVAVVLTLVAVVLAAGFLSGNKTRFLNASNLAALAALERFVRDQTPGASYFDRAASAKNQANQVLSAQALIAGVTPLGSLGFEGAPGDGGVIRFGMWYPENPEKPDPGPCNNNYPCYVDADPQPVDGYAGPVPPINAVRIEARAPNAFLAPLKAFLGQDRFDLRTKSTSAVVQRCTVFLLDASISSTMQTHALWMEGDLMDLAPSEPGFCGIGESRNARPMYFLCPRNSAYFAFDAEILRISGPMFLDPALWGTLFGRCQDWESSIYGQHGGKVWCNMEWDGDNVPRVRPVEPSSENVHYVGDYSYIDSLIGETAGDLGWRKLIVDMVGTPQPMSSFLLGYNAGLRLLQTQTSTADKVAMMVFKNGVIDKIPISGFTSSLGFLVQLTHGENYKDREPGGERGTKEQVFPNWVTRGWLTDSRGITDERAGTNIADALLEAISILADPGNCPASAQKSIVLASDGMSSCFPNECGAPPTCASGEAGHEKYVNAETALLRYDPCTLDPKDSVLSRLLDAQIALTVLFSGVGIMPNFVDRRKGGEGPFLSYEEARALGYTGLPLGEDPAAPGNHNIFFDSRSCCSDEGCDCAVGHCPCEGGDREAYERFGRPGVFFLRPNGVFGEMAMRTGGYFCPLNSPMEPEETYYWDHDENPATPKVLKDEYRTEGFRQTAALRYMPPGAYAAECVQATLGLNPFILVEEE